MKTTFLTILIFAALEVSATAAVPPPSNLTVTRQSDNYGKQYFVLTFQRPIVHSDNIVVGRYVVTRWDGAVPDTTHRTEVVNIEVGDSATILCTDFNGDSPWTGLSYSYSVKTMYLQDSTLPWKYSAPSELVHGELIARNLSWVSPESIDTIVRVGDTLRLRFSTTDDSGAIVRYSITGKDGYASCGLDSITGNFWAVPPITDLTGFSIRATDNNGGITCHVNVRGFMTQETLMVYLIDPTTGKLPDCNMHVFPYFVPQIGDTMHQQMFGWPSFLYPDGGLMLICDSGVYKLRIEALGFQADWINDPAGNSVISASGSVRHFVTPAPTVNYHIRVREVHSMAPIGGVRLEVDRLYGLSHGTFDGQEADTIDATGEDGSYSLSIPTGDSTTGTNRVAFAATCLSHFFYESQSTDYFVTNHDAYITLEFDSVSNQDGILPVRVVGEEGTPLSIGTSITVYRLEDTSKIIVTRDSLNAIDWQYFVLPFGKYIVFAKPMPWFSNDSNYISAYYKKNSSADLWTDADTIVVMPDSMQPGVSIQLRKDKSFVPAAGGSQLGGLVRTNGAPSAHVHVVLYRDIGAPAGTAVVKELFKTTSTDRDGRYQFLQLPTGTYTLTVDNVGYGPYQVAAIVVDSSRVISMKDINFTTTGVSSQTEMILPDDATLLQSYPNPFFSSSIFSFTLADRTVVDLQLFDVAGHHVATLLHEAMEAGPHVLNFRTQLPAGEYSCRMQAGLHHATRRITLMR